MRKSERVRRRARCVLRGGGYDGGADILDFDVLVVVIYGCCLFRVFTSLEGSMSRGYILQPNKNKLADIQRSVLTVRAPKKTSRASATSPLSRPLHLFIQPTS